VILPEVRLLPNHNRFLPGQGVPGLVSIVIPCYNRAHIVRETIDSVLAQTYANFEAIIIDDGSADNTRDVITRYTDRRIRYFYKSQWWPVIRSQCRAGCGAWRVCRIP
jgi:cellulose synthase/poly-beta-1,6-N-acetylglucosamine synthase-like glycosyltransferase